MNGAHPPGVGFLRSGGWWLVAGLVLAGVAFSYYALQIVGARGAHAVGDGRDVATYGFPLAPCLVPRALLVASGMPKDGLPALVEPGTWPASRADTAGAARGRLLVPEDRVIGISLGGVARAYPLRFLVWHEVVNDTLAGVPIVVTYSALCDSAVAARRTVGGRTLLFGVSGLLYDSNLVMYDREEQPGHESLWSQLLFKAITGPAAAGGATLEVLPISVERWADWRREHPSTTVLAPDPRMRAQYSRDPYTSYFGNDMLRFPVEPLPSPARYRLKEPVVAIGGASGWTAFPFAALVANVPEGDTPAAVSAVSGALRVRRETPATVAVDLAALPRDAGVVYASYFAWYATHGADTVWADRAR